MLARKALLVDDSKSARFVLSKLLRQHDFEVEMVDSAEAALDFLSTSIPDAIFMDHLMKGMDGLEATSKIKKDPGTAHIPVVMCTSNDGEEYLREAMSHGALGTLVKPPSSEKLQEILNAVEKAIDANKTTHGTVALADEPVPPVADNTVINLPLGDAVGSGNTRPGNIGSTGLELREIEDSIAALIAQKLRKFEQNLEQRFKDQRQELLSLIEQRLENAGNDDSQSDLQSSIESRFEALDSLLESRIGALKNSLGTEVMASTSVSKQVQEIARETAANAAEESAKVVARNTAQRAAREAVAPELEHRLEEFRKDLYEVKQEISGRAGMFAFLAAVTGIVAAAAVYFLAG